MEQDAAPAGMLTQACTRAVSGLRPPGHYEPAARSSLTQGANAQREARPGAGCRLTGDDGDRCGGASGGGTSLTGT